MRVQWECCCHMTEKQGLPASWDWSEPSPWSGGIGPWDLVALLAQQCWLWCSPQLMQHPWCCLMVCFPICVLCRFPAALWGPRETYQWPHSPLSLSVWWSTQHVCITGKSEQPRSGEVKRVWTTQFLCNWEFFTVKWNTLSFGVNKMCTYKIWKCMVAGDCLRAVSICCQECWVFIF